MPKEVVSPVVPFVAIQFAVVVEIVDLVEVLALDFPAAPFHWEVVALTDPNVVDEEASD